MMDRAGKTASAGRRCGGRADGSASLSYLPREPARLRGGRQASLEPGRREICGAGEAAVTRRWTAPRARRDSPARRPGAGQSPVQTLEPRASFSIEAASRRRLRGRSRGVLQSVELRLRRLDQRQRPRRLRRGFRNPPVRHYDRSAASDRLSGSRWR